MECCRVDDTSPECVIVGLPPGWVDPDVGRLYIYIDPLGHMVYTGALGIFSIELAVEVTH